MTTCIFGMASAGLAESIQSALPSVNWDDFIYNLFCFDLFCLLEGCCKRRAASRAACVADYVWGCCRLLSLAAKIHHKTRTGVQLAAPLHHMVCEHCQKYFKGPVWNI